MDRVTQTLLDALRLALSEPGERRLYRSGKLDGLFPGRAGVGGEAAARALADGLLESVRTEIKGKTTIEWVRLTPAGVEFLHQHESPLRALEEVRAALRLNQQAVPVWLAEMRAGLEALDARLLADAQKWMQKLDALTHRVEDTLRRVEEERPLLPRELGETYPWSVDALNYLDRRKSGGAPGDCPLPELFAALTGPHANLSVFAFHEGLRRLHDRRVLRLKPVPDGVAMERPEFALFDGGVVLYFAGR